MVGLIFVDMAKAVLSLVVQTESELWLFYFLLTWPKLFSHWLFRLRVNCVWFNFY